MEELLKKLLEVEMAKMENAQKAETPAAPAAPAFDMSALVEALKPAIAAAVEENVAKALPARTEGVGPKGEVQAEKPNPLAELVKKANTNPASLTPAEKNAVWALTYAALKQGLREDTSER